MSVPQSLCLFTFISPDRIISYHWSLAKPTHTVLVLCTCGLFWAQQNFCNALCCDQLCLCSSWWTLTVTAGKSSNYNQKTKSNCHVKNLHCLSLKPVHQTRWLSGLFVCLGIFKFILCNFVELCILKSFLKVRLSPWSSTRLFSDMWQTIAAELRALKVTC